MSDICKRTIYGTDNHRNSYFSIINLVYSKNRNERRKRNNDSINDANRSNIYERRVTMQ